MDPLNKIITDLEVRLGYGEETTITRDEIKMLVLAASDLTEELEEEIEGMREEISELQEKADEAEELERKLERIKKITEE